MQWIVYLICGLLVILAIYILVKEIRKMLKGKCCENCKHCTVKDRCDAKDEQNNKEN